MDYSYECGMSVRHVTKKTVVTSTTTSTSSENGSELKRSLIEMSAKGSPAFPRHDVKMFVRDEFSSMSSESFSYNSKNDHCGSVYGRSVTTTTTGGGGENRRYTEHFTKSPGRGDEQPITVVMKERSHSELPEWMEERKSPGTERGDVDVYNISVFLKYPGHHTSRKNEPEDNANERKIHPEVAKRERSEITLSLDEDDGEEVVTCRGDEQPIMVVMKTRSHSDLPEWMEERKSPGTERGEVDVYNISVSLKYPGHYTPRKTEPEDNANEGKIHPEVAKRERSEITLSLDEDDEEVVTCRGDEQPITVVMKERSHSELPEWMEERKSPGTERGEGDVYNISVSLKYPGHYTPRKTEPEDNANESKIHPEVAKRERSEITLSLNKDDEDDDDDDDEEEESDEEYDEFEEEIVVVDVRRKPVWRKGLEIPKPQPQKVGVPVEDLLELPTLQPKQESGPDEIFIDEKIEHVERPPAVYAELPDFGKNL